MIPINDSGLYKAALATLNEAVGRRYLGRIAQIFFACKHYGKAIPQIGDPAGITTGELQKLLDDLYSKPHRRGPEKIVILFENDHKVPSGQTAPGLRYPSNIWRNNFNLQKGYMCYGSVSEFSNQQFHRQSRTLCSHLVPAVPGSLADASCGLSPGAEYRNEDHPKVLRKDPQSGEYFVYNPSDISFYSSILLPSNGNKLPIIAVMVALYYDGVLAAGRTSVTIEDFLTDFDISPAEANAYFEDDPASVAHSKLIALRPSLSWTRRVDVAMPPVGPAPQLPGLPAIPVPTAPRTRTPRKLAAQPTGVTLPPAGGFWWNAQQAVRKVLENAGWAVVDFSALGTGYDLKATKGSALYLVEVKSSVGPCAPTLTSREYVEASANRKRYVLAIVEHFDPRKPATVKWVQDPASLQTTARQVKEYYLPRSVWSKATSSIL
ncbi:MAG: protein NO VEIN domain-containing protein [Reyranella sp.]